ncbi:MAG: acylphosphatase [Alphaproteobacteria bacterium]|nr:acylphosphatase [Alphaproteobacteria bacterium]
MAGGLHIVVKGRVQGVGFRAWTVEQARTLNLAGFVRNRIDGTVEIQVVGPPERLSQFLRLVEQGPPLAWVSDLAQRELTPEEQGALPQVFQQTATA